MDVSSIPKKYGGDLDFECGMMPSIDPEIRKCLDLPNPKLEELFLTGPTRWVDGPEGDMVALSVGSINGKPHKEAVATMHSWAVRTATGSSNFQRMYSDYFQPMDSESSSAAQSRPQSKGGANSQVEMQPPPPAQAPLGTETQGLAPSVEQPPAHQQAPSTIGNPPHAMNMFSTGSSQRQVQPVQPIQQLPPPTTPPAMIHSQPQATITPESESALPNGTILTSQPAGFNGQTEIRNGEAGPPKNLAMPPTQLQRMETQYMTPASEPSELKNFQ